VDIVHGVSIFEFLSRHPHLVQGFQAAMSERTAAFAPSVATGYDFSPMRTVADIGGGKGTRLAAILPAHGHWRGVLFDRSRVVADAADVFGQLVSQTVARSCRETSSGASRTAPTATFWPTCCTTGMTQIRCESWRIAAGPWPKMAGCSSSSV